MTNQPQEQIEDILTAIRKACPELYDGPKRLIKFDHSTEDIETYKPIHLEHLLRAIDSEHKGNYFIDTEGWLVRNNRLLREQLRKIKIDLTLSLRQNLENTDLREFIHSLLKV